MSGPVGGIDFTDGQTSGDSIDRDFGLDFKALSGALKGLHEAAGKDSVTRQDIVNAAPEEPADGAGEERVTQTVSSRPGVTTG